MSETTNLKIVAPDANSVLVPLHGHFAALASSVDKGVTDRLQLKYLRYETVEARQEEYEELNPSHPRFGKVIDETTGKPDLVDGDRCLIIANKREYVWNVNPSGGTGWLLQSKQFTFDSKTVMDAVLPEDLYEGDTAYLKDVDQVYLWSGSAWLPAFGRTASFLGKQTGTISMPTANSKYTLTFNSTLATGGFTEASGIVTVPFNGWYQIGLQLNYASAAAGSRDAIVAAGPSAAPVEILMQRMRSDVTTTAYVNLAGAARLNAGEIIRAQGASTVASLSLTGAVIPCMLTVNFLGA
jgi:hypothetical protein